VCAKPAPATAQANAIANQTDDAEIISDVVLDTIALQEAVEEELLLSVKPCQELSTLKLSG
jgi:hypothetical protein